MHCGPNGQNSISRDDNEDDRNRRAPVFSSKLSMNARCQRVEITTARQNRASILRITTNRSQHRFVKMETNISPLKSGYSNTSSCIRYKDKRKVTTKGLCTPAEIKEISRSGSSLAAPVKTCHYNDKTLHLGDLRPSVTSINKSCVVPSNTHVPGLGTAQTSRIKQSELVDSSLNNSQVESKPHCFVTSEMNKKKEISSCLGDNRTQLEREKYPTSNKEGSVMDMERHPSLDNEMGPPKIDNAQEVSEITTCTTPVTMKKEPATETKPPTSDNSCQTSFRETITCPLRSCGESPVFQKDSFSFTTDKISRLNLLVKKTFACIRAKRFNDTVAAEQRSQRIEHQFRDPVIFTAARCNTRPDSAVYTNSRSSDTVEVGRFRVPKGEYTSYTKRQLHLRLQEVAFVTKEFSAVHEILSELLNQLQRVSLTLNEQHGAVRGLTKLMEELISSRYSPVRSQPYCDYAHKSPDRMQSYTAVEETSSRPTICPSTRPQSQTRTPCHRGEPSTFNRRTDPVFQEGLNQVYMHDKSMSTDVGSDVGKLDEIMVTQGSSCLSESIIGTSSPINQSLKTASLRAEHNKDTTTSHRPSIMHDELISTTQPIPHLPTSQCSEKGDGLFDINPTDLISSMPSSPCSSEPTPPTMIEGAFVKNDIASRGLKQYYRIDYLESDGGKCADPNSLTASATSSFNGEGQARSSKEVVKFAKQLLESDRTRKWQNHRRSDCMSSRKGLKNCSQVPEQRVCTGYQLHSCNKLTHARRNSLNAHRRNRTGERFTPDSGRSPEVRVTCFGDVTTDSLPPRMVPRSKKVRPKYEPLSSQPHTKSEDGIKRVWENTGDPGHHSSNQTSSIRECIPLEAKGNRKSEVNSIGTLEKNQIFGYRNPMFFKDTADAYGRRCGCSPIHTERCSSGWSLVGGSNNNSAYLGVSETTDQKYHLSDCGNQNASQCTGSYFNENRRICDPKVHFITGSTVPEAADHKSLLEGSSKPTEYALPEPVQTGKDSLVAQKLRIRAEQQRQIDQLRLMDELRQLQQRRAAWQLKCSKMDGRALTPDRETLRVLGEPKVHTALIPSKQDGRVSEPPSEPSCDTSSRGSGHVDRKWLGARTEQQEKQLQESTIPVTSNSNRRGGAQQMVDFQCRAEERTNFHDGRLSLSDRHDTTVLSDPTPSIREKLRTEMRDGVPDSAVWKQRFVPTEAHQSVTLNGEQVPRGNPGVECSEDPLTNSCKTHKYMDAKTSGHERNMVPDCTQFVHWTCVTCRAHTTSPKWNHPGHCCHCIHQRMLATCGCCHYPKHFTTASPGRISFGGEQRNLSTDTSASESCSTSSSPISSSSGQSEDLDVSSISETSDSKQQHYYAMRLPESSYAYNKQECLCVEGNRRLHRGQHHHHFDCDPTQSMGSACLHWFPTPPYCNGITAQARHVLSSASHHLCAQLCHTNMHVMGHPTITRPQMYMTKPYTVKEVQGGIAPSRCSVRFKLPDSDPESGEK
ncbi:unnamed protein product [Dicrocoelium dendriticum]|nr:unnamed protein product [Dicrocoelium dendriticum]